MTLLAKIGTIILRATEVLSGFGPLFAAVSPQAGPVVATVTSDLQQIAGIITSVEAVGQALALPGAQKLTAASPLVAQVVLQSALLANHKIANPELFKAGSTKIADGMADVLNSLHGDVDTTNKT